MNLDEILNWKKEESPAPAQKSAGGDRGMTVSEILAYKPQKSARRDTAPAASTPRQTSQGETPNAVYARNYSRAQATRERDDARKQMDALKAERAELAGVITDDLSASMYADRLAELDRQYAEAKSRHDAADAKYKDVYADYNAARKEYNAAERALAIQEEAVTDENYEQKLKDAETRLANAREAYVAQGGDPTASAVGAALGNFTGDMLGVARWYLESSRNGGQSPAALLLYSQDELKKKQQALDEKRKARYEAKHGAGTWKPAYERVEELSNKFNERAAGETQSIKEGRSELGQIAQDVAIQGIQQAADWTVGQVAGGPLVSMALRSFGGAAQEAKDAGATIGQQGLYGLGTAAVEVLSEKMFDGMAGLYGAGMADDVVSHMIGKLTENKLGQAALGIAFDALGEGAEEVVSDVINPFLRGIYTETSGWENFKDTEWQDVAYDFLIGAIMGGLGGSVELVTDVTGVKAPDARSEFFMEAGEKGMSFKQAMTEWKKNKISSGFATETGDTSITNEANEYLARLNDGKRVSERKIDRLNERAASVVSNADIANTVTAVEQRMQQLGKNDPTLARAITAVALADEAERIGARNVFATEEQRRLVKNDATAQRILSEMDVENLRNEQAAGYMALLQNRAKGATKEDYDRAVAPYQRSNEWVKTMQQNKALAADVYGRTASISEEERTAQITYSNKKGNSVSGQIVGINKDGTVRVKHGDGGKFIDSVDIDKIKGISDNYRTLLKAAASRKNGNVMVQAYRPGQDVNGFVRAWDMAENYYGVTNLTVEKARAAFSLRELTNAQIELAMELGREAAKKRGVTEEAKQQKVTGEVQFHDGKGTIEGVEYDATSEEEAKKLLGEAEYAFIKDVLAKVVNVTLVKSKEVNGAYEGAQGIFFRDGRIYFDVNAGLNSSTDIGKRTIVLTAAHELTHYIRAYNEKAYDALQKFISEELVRQGKNIEDLIKQKQRRSGMTLSPEEAMEEVVADACETMLTDGDQIRAFASQHEAEARGIYKWLDKFFSKWENAFGRLSARHEEAKAMQGRITELRQMWLDALAGANENAMAAQGGEENGTGANVTSRNSIRNTRNQTLKEQLKDFYGNKMKSSDSFYFGESTEAMGAVGVSGPMGMTQKAFVKSSKGKHNIPRRVWNKLEANLAEPILAFYNDDVAAFLLDDIDGDGKPVIAAFDKNGVMDREHVAEITSVLGLDNPAAWVDNQWKKEKKQFKAFDVEKATAFLQTYSSNATVGENGDSLIDTLSQSAEESNTKIGEIDIADFSKAKGTDGKALFQVRAFENDEAQYRDMLTEWGGMSTGEIDSLFRTVDSAMNVIKSNLEALDYAWDADIDDRAFQPVKPNSDKLYKVSQDFSTLCRKRILQQLVAGHLQAALNRAITREEGIAIRDALIAIQKEGKQIEVACALCYVESARMRSPKQIQKFLDNREAVIRDFFAGRDAAGTKQRMAEAEAREREAIYEEYGLIHGKGADSTMYDVRDSKTASLKKMPGFIATRIRAAKKSAKAGYAPTAEQQALINAAKEMTVSDFTTPEGLENLAKNYRELFDAYTSYIRNATNSKGIENDTWWRVGDSQKISDLLVEQMNRENGLRTQSWSDFQVKHLMDYIAATIELSTRNAKQHAYTKVIDYVDLMGNTGVMINMSLIPTREFTGKLTYDDVEGFVYKEAMRLRDKYHATAGTICIGVDNQQIALLLASDKIDYVIPYHRSGMAAHIRAAMHIPSWSEYESVQNEQALNGAEARANAAKYGVELLDQSDENWHVAPKFSDWFDLQTAKQEAELVGKSGKYGVMTGGYAAMQNAARRYMEICAERGLAPKFSYGKGDFSTLENYWKLLIDRKMVDNVTGDIIEQKAIKPVFEMDTIQRILDDELARYGRVKEDQNEAIRRVSEAFLGGKIKAGMSSEEIESIMQKPVDDISKVNITQSARDAGIGTKLSSREQAAAEIEQSDVNTKYSLRQEAPPKKTMIGYKVFMVSKKHPGQLYPTKVQNPGGQGTPLGVWLNADTGELARNPDGSLKVNTKGRLAVEANGGTLAWRPGWHLGSLPEANQMNRANPNDPNSNNSNRGSTGLMWDNYVFCECEFAADEDYQLEAFEYGTDEKGRYTHTQAGLPYIPKDGYYKYRTNPDPSTAPWFISGAIKITKILDDNMRRDIIAKWNAEHPDEQMRFTERYSGKDIDLAEYGLKAGPVTPSTDLKSIAPGVDYSDEIRNLPGYTRHALNFDDPRVQEAFRIQQIEDKKDSYIERYNRTHRAELGGKNADREYFTTGNLDVDTDRAFAAAMPLQADLNRIVLGISKMLETEYGEADQKSKKSIKKKVVRKHKAGRTDYSVLDMKDHARSKVFVNDWNEIPRVLAYLRSQGIKYETEAIGPTLFGYKGFHVTWRDTNGLGTELQITMPYAWQVKLESDGIYDRWRDYTNLDEIPRDLWDEYYADMERSRKLWSDIYLPDFKTWESSDSDSSLLSQSSAADTGATGLTQLPPEYSSSPSRLTSKMRPSSVNANMGTPPTQDSIDIISQDRGESKSSLRDNGAVQKTKDHYNERLDKLRAEKNAKIEEIRKEEAERRQAAVKKEKAAKWSKVEETEAYYKGVIQGQRNKRSRTETRGKIKALHKELSDMLLKPKEGRYVPRDLVKATADILGAVDTTSARAVKAKAALAQLKVQYDALAQEPKYSLVYDETVSGMLQEIAKDFGDANIYELTNTELESLYNTLKALKHTIATANKLIGAQIEADAFEAANQMMRETENAKGIPTKLLRKFVMSQMTPASAFRLFGGYVKNSMWEQMYNMLNQGQLTQTQILMEGGQIFRDLIDDKKNLDKLHDKKNLVDVGLKDDQGNSIKITRGMMLSVYMHLLNEQNARHVAYGGFTVPRLREYYANDLKDAFTGKTGRAVAFATEIADLNEQLDKAETVAEQNEIKERLAELQDETAAYMSNLRAEIEKQLTDYDRKWIAAAQEFFDVYSKGKLNEVTEMVYGFSKAQVDNYFPIHTDPNYRSASFDTITRDMSLENAGFMKERINGSNPILLEDITDVIASQLRRTAQYCGLMPAIRNFNKAYGKARAGYSMSVQSAMARTFENEGKQYIENLMADLNGARRSEADFWDALRGNMAAATLTLNPRVTLAQTASFPTAAAELGYTPLIKALTDMKNPMWDKGLQEEIAKWTPLWWYRMQGFSNTELGDIKSNEQFMNKVMERTKWLAGWIQAADGLTTGGLWQASKYYVDEHFTDLKKGSDEYMMKVAEVYNRVIERTQPDYTVLQRPDILRNPNKLVKQLTMFMTQRLQNANILYDAAATYSKYVRDADAGRNGVTRADVAQARTRLAWAVSSQIMASSTIVLFKWLADAIMHNLKAYRDDDDELTAESRAKALLKNFVETSTSNVIGASEVFSLVNSIMSGGKYYGVSITSIDSINDVGNAIYKIATKLKSGDTEGARKAAWGLAKDMSQTLGLPTANVEKIVNAAVNHIKDAQEGTYQEAGVDRTRAQNTHILFDALQSGDTAKADRVRAEYKDKNDEQSALKGYIRDLYTDMSKGENKMRKPEVISLLQKYCGMTKRAAEDTAQQWTMEVVTGIKYSDLQDGYISGEIPKVKAVKYYQTYTSNGRTTQAEAEEKILEWTCEKDTGIKYSGIADEVKTGRLGKEKAVRMVEKYGGKSEEQAEKTVESWLIEHEYDIRPSELEDEYTAGRVSDDDALDILLRYKYFDKDEAETKAQEELERMQFVKENPEAEGISITQVRNYNASGLNGYVSPKDYVQAAKMMGTFEGLDENGDGKTDRYSVVQQKLDYIDSLELNPEQKTALAIALGLNEKTIRRKAPWL